MFAWLVLLLVVSLGMLGYTHCASIEDIGVLRSIPNLKYLLVDCELYKILENFYKILTPHT